MCGQHDGDKGGHPGAEIGRCGPSVRYQDVAGSCRPPALRPPAEHHRPPRKLPLPLHGRPAPQEPHRAVPDDALVPQGDAGAPRLCRHRGQGPQVRADRHRRRVRVLRPQEPVQGGALRAAPELLAARLHDRGPFPRDLARLWPPAPRGFRDGADVCRERRLREAPQEAGLHLRQDRGRHAGVPAREGELVEDAEEGLSGGRDGARTDLRNGSTLAPWFIVVLRQPGIPPIQKQYQTQTEALRALKTVIATKHPPKAKQKQSIDNVESCNSRSSFGVRSVAGSGGVGGDVHRGGRRRDKRTGRGRHRGGGHRGSRHRGVLGRQLHREPVAALLLPALHRRRPRPRHRRGRHGRRRGSLRRRLALLLTVLVPVRPGKAVPVRRRIRHEHERRRGVVPRRRVDLLHPLVAGDVVPAVGPDKDGLLRGHEHRHVREEVAVGVPRARQRTRGGAGAAGGGDEHASGAGGDGGRGGGGGERVAVAGDGEVGRRYRRCDILLLHRRKGPVAAGSLRGH